MKDREPTPDRDSEAGRDRSARAASGPSADKHTDVDMPAPDEEQFDSLGATRVTSSPIPDADFDDALAEREVGHQAPRSAGNSARRTGAVLGDFQLVRKLGQGAMASVYKARQISFDRKVALKLLHKHVADSPKLVERFYREARIMGELDHPNIVQGFGVGMAEGFHYFAMEYISGVNLQAWLNKLGRIPVADALHIIMACCAGLEYAHNHGLVHRDVKPDNVLITRQGAIKLADLGMVKAMDEDMSLTQTGHAVGTPWYMPLEQARNAKEVDGRSDIYALGCMLYYLVTGRPPFRGSSIVEVIQAKEIGTFPPARQVNDDVPDRLDLIIAKMTAKLPKHRYQHCRDVIRDLQELNLASEELTFLRQPEKAEETLAPGSTTALEATPPQRATPLAKNEWHLQVKTPTGQMTVKLMTTEQISAMLESGVLNANAQAGRQPEGPFRSIATFKEFESVALALATKAGADNQAIKFRRMYKKLEERNEERVQKRQEEAADDETIEHGFRTALIIGGAVISGALLFYLIFLFYVKPFLTLQ
jgi:serine/threonine-protein kinase